VENRSFDAHENKERNVHAHPGAGRWLEWGQRGSFFDRMNRMFRIDEKRQRKKISPGISGEKYRDAKMKFVRRANK
jgi:hypothetical protein